jgi:hypothetical protein
MFGIQPLSAGSRKREMKICGLGRCFKLKAAADRVDFEAVSMMEPKQFMWLLMLIPFSAVLLGIFIYLLRRHGATLHPAQFEDFASGGYPLPRRGFRSPFEQPCRWLAVRSRDLGAVQRALGLVHPTPCSWEEGLNEADEHKLFVSPPVNGWILVVGAGLPDPGDDVDKCHCFLMNLSRKLGHVQYFGFNRALNHHAWAIIERGFVIRAYAWAGRTLWNQGPRTAAEKDAGMVCFDYAADPSDYALRENWTLNTEKVGRLAGWWSVDPLTIAEKTWQARQGIVGNLSHSRQR